MHGPLRAPGRRPRRPLLGHVFTGEHHAEALELGEDVRLRGSGWS